MHVNELMLCLRKTLTLHEVSPVWSVGKFSWANVYLDHFISPSPSQKTIHWNSTSEKVIMKFLI